MPRDSRIEVVGRRTADGMELAGGVYPSGRLVIEKERMVVIYPDADAAPFEAIPLADASVIRPGVMYREEDESGVSGTGVVADFAEFPNGQVVQEWRNEENGNLETRGIHDSGIDIRPTIDMAVQIHGHGGRTKYRYDDGEVAGDGS